MRYSDYIDRLVLILEKNDVPVEINLELPIGVIGRCYNKQEDGRTAIELNTPDAREALLALAHEAGHWIGNEYSFKPHKYQRERQAFIYGWHMLCLVAADKVVTRDEWIAFHHYSRWATFFGSHGQA